MYDLLIRDAWILDGGDAPGVRGDVAVSDGRIAACGRIESGAAQVIDAGGRALAPGFIDVHTHDDLEVIRTPHMRSKLSQGVTTVVVGNCGISASPVTVAAEVPDPMNLLGEAGEFRYPDFASYRQAVETAVPAVNVAALVGHTALRQNHMERLDRAATAAEIAAMRAQLRDSLAAGALGLSSGLAYASAFCAPADEVAELARELPRGGLYATHLRDEFAGIVAAMDEAFDAARDPQAAVRVSHLKCAGIDNWGRSGEVLARLQDAACDQDVACDCYPYAASASTLDLKQVTGAYDILITWSEPEPAQGGRLLAEIAADWNVDLHAAARRLQPAGAVYHCMDEADVRRILSHPLTMIGSDGLPRDPRPHPRLWGTFPRVLGHYARDQQLFPLHTAVHKMTGLPAARFALGARGRIRTGWWADLVLFDPQRVRDTASFHDPVRAAEGIDAVWVNGQLAYDGREVVARNGRFIAPEAAPTD
ncbi:D-aminoacylase [Flavobacterium sp. MXW15]|uniref:D-aminoacylase n=1 Tax=Xanthomonas chitinilytica TaxID=2989819 RepID=A0ABT3JTE7_9XANT|nr:D-aminoacylase [Xanthomonas sp. H13-6]MCW4454526.1 D-aminoacylase [Flavobacterium sp. MXW15]MCW4471765.1 D-aminoacylase [Xanthomonas sp. H13-6]